MNPVTPTQDQLGLPLRDLRVSVTDRCNFRCRYCMPRETFGPGFRFLPRAEILGFEEITRAVEAAEWRTSLQTQQAACARARGPTSLWWSMARSSRRTWHPGPLPG